MSLHHLVERLSVKRNVPKVACFDEAESLKKISRFIHSQQNLDIKNHYKIISERNQKRLQQNRDSYQRNADAIAKKQREAYKNSPERRLRIAARSKQWKQKNRDKARAANRKWQLANRDKRNAALKRYYKNLKKRLTIEEFKAFISAKNKKAIARKIAKVGIEAYRKQENARHKAWRENLPPEKIEIQRAKSRERQRKRLEKIKQSPALLAIHREKQAENQRKQRAKRKLQKEKQA